MKRILLLIAMVACSSAAFAQPSKLHCENCEFFADGVLRGRYLKMPRGRVDYAMHAYKEGFVTQRIDPVESFEKGVTVNINLEPIEEYNLERNTKVISFRGYKDLTGHLDGATGVAPYVGYYEKPDISSNEFGSQFTNKIDEYGYDVNMLDPRAFSTKEKTPEVVIAGEILKFHKETKGTPGFKITLEVRWVVFDVARDQVVYEMVNIGYTDTRQPNKINIDLMNALDDATIALVHDEEFKKFVMPVDGLVSAGEAIVLDKIEPGDFATPADMIKTATGSALTVVTQRGHGSGFVISSDGFALTSQHVISGFEDCQVVFNNGFKMNAKVVSFDVRHDVALLKIEGSGFNGLPLGNPASAAIGSEVVTVGTPASLELGQSVTKGVVSGVRDVEGVTYVQTDASISPGNSGGALIDSQGRAIGIIAAKIVDENVEGLGFAVSVHQAVKALNVTFK